MESSYGSSSPVVRFTAACAAAVVTAGLFAAVAFGLTGDGDWSLFALSPLQATAVA